MERVSDVQEECRTSSGDNGDVCVMLLNVQHYFLFHTYIHTYILTLTEISSTWEYIWPWPKHFFSLLCKIITKQLTLENKLSNTHHTHTHAQPWCFFKTSHLENLVPVRTEHLQHHHVRSRFHPYPPWQM